MPDVSSRSLAELRTITARLGDDQLGPWTRALALDGRAGARSLAEHLEQRRARRRSERTRVRRMLRLERRLWSQGVRRVAGVDEVGVGPLAGPVVAAAVILPEGELIEGLDDSKQLDRHVREALDREIRERATAVAIGRAEVAEIAELNVYGASLLAMQRAVLALAPPPEHLLVDARVVPSVPVPQDAHVKGDALSCSIAAASVVAKVHRDGLMAELARRYPVYGFERHQGYGTPEHARALRENGPCPEHRTRFLAVAEHAGDWSAAYYDLRDELRAVSGADSLERWRRHLASRADELEKDELKKLDAMHARRVVRHAPDADAQGRLPIG